MLLKVNLTVKILARRDEEVAFTASKKEEVIFQHSQIMNQRLIDWVKDKMNMYHISLAYQS